MLGICPFFRFTNLLLCILIDIMETLLLTPDALTQNAQALLSEYANLFSDVAAAGTNSSEEATSDGAIAAMDKVLFSERNTIKYPSF